MKDILKGWLNKLKPDAAEADAHDFGFNAVGLPPSGVVRGTETTTRFRLGEMAPAPMTPEKLEGYVGDTLSSLFEQHPAPAPYGEGEEDNPFAGIRVPFVPRKKAPAAPEPADAGLIIQEELADGTIVTRRFAPQAEADGTVHLQPESDGPAQP